MEPTINNPYAKATSCIFCEIVDGRAPATILDEYDNTLIIIPLNPVVPGHVIAISKRHVTDFATRWDTTGETMGDLAHYVQVTDPDKEYNIITSKGRNATQSVFHLHIHLVPREENDGLALPWFSGKPSKKYSEKRKR